jgi:hypothetical protein
VTVIFFLTGDHDRPFVLLKDEPITDAKVDDVLSKVITWKQSCVDVEKARLHIQQLESNLDALRKLVLKTKITPQPPPQQPDQVSSDWLHNDTITTTLMIR